MYDPFSSSLLCPERAVRIVESETIDAGEPLNGGPGRKIHHTYQGAYTKHNQQILLLQFAAARADRLQGRSDSAASYQGRNVVNGVEKDQKMGQTDKTVNTRRIV